MLTRRLFEENVKTQRFEARVLSCTEEKGKYHIELDATAFFPEGGGQPGDQGELFPGLKEDGEPVKVLDTREKACIRRRNLHPLALCAFELTFRHPSTRKSMTFSCQPAGEIFRKF